MRRTLMAVTAVCAFMLAGCGGTAVHTTNTTSTPRTPAVVPVPGPGGQCTPENYSMQCGLQGQRAPVSALAAPTAVVARGIDFGWGGPPVSWLRANGLQFAISYYSYDPSKDWGAGQVASYHAGGIVTVGTWETSQARALGGYQAGVDDARQARREANAVGQPSGRPIYFAVDFQSDGYGCAICGYFRGVNHVLGVARTGGYGGLATINTLFNNHLIAYGWQTYAWSNGRWDGRAQLQQYLNGSAVDWDRATRPDYGQWPYKTPVNYPVCYHHRIPRAQCQAVQAKVANWTKAEHATNNALGGVQAALKANHCRQPYRRDVCVDLGREVRPVLVKRWNWYWQQIRRTKAAN